MIPSQLVHIVFELYTMALFLRIMLSWFPAIYQYKATHYLMAYTDPYLNLFGRVLPPIGGVLDLSPILSFFALRMLECLVLKIV